MATSICSLPVELIEAICEADQTITPKLRASCGDLGSKTLRSFSTHFFEWLTVSPDVKSMAILLKISQTPHLASAVKTLHFAMNDYRAHLKHRKRACIRQKDFISSGSFGYKLTSILERLPRCEVLLMGASRTTLGGILTPSLTEMPLTYDADIQGLDGRWQVDISDPFQSIMLAVNASQSAIRKITIGHYMATFIHPLCLERITSGLSSTNGDFSSLRDFTLNLRLDHKIEPHGSQAREDTSSDDNLGAPRSGRILGHFLESMPHLRSLSLETHDEAWKWMPRTFGAQLEELTLTNSYWPYLGFDGRDDAMLVTALRRSPKLTKLRLERFNNQDVEAAQSSLRTLAKLDYVRSLVLENATVDGVPLCLKKECISFDPEESMHFSAMNAEDWGTTDLVKDLPRWSDWAHEFTLTCFLQSRPSLQSHKDQWPSTEDRHPRNRALFELLAKTSNGTVSVVHEVRRGKHKRNCQRFLTSAVNSAH